MRWKLPGFKKVPTWGTFFATGMAKKSYTPIQEPSQNEIARRAHEIWEREGRPEGRSTEHWLAAEKELRASEPHAAAEPPREHKAAAPRRGKRLELVS